MMERGYGVCNCRVCLVGFYIGLGYGEDGLEHANNVGALNRMKVIYVSCLGVPHDVQSR